MQIVSLFSKLSSKLCFFFEKKTREDSGLTAASSFLIFPKISKIPRTGHWPPRSQDHGLILDAFINFFSKILRNRFIFSSFRGRGACIKYIKLGDAASFHFRVQAAALVQCAIGKTAGCPTVSTHRGEEHRGKINYLGWFFSTQLRNIYRRGPHFSSIIDKQ